MVGIIHSYESLAAVDGEGLRFCVFLAGCPLRCIYCHNPDTWDKNGKKVSAEELIQKLKRYRSYFGEKGGVTFSGGEPLQQAEFLVEMKELLLREKIGYVIDTSGSVLLTDSVKEVLSGSQEVLLDLKFWDDASYRSFTGGSIDNTLKTLDYLESINKPTVIRTVIVPGINDTEQALSRYFSMIKGKKFVKRYELLGFHTMGFFKYNNLGIDNPLKEIKSMDMERLKQLQLFVNKKVQ